MATSDICTGIVFATRKPCDKPAVENGFCVKHQSQIFIREAAEKGEVVCRHFARGCRNYVSKEDLAHNLRACAPCRTALQRKEKSCEHDGCKHKVEADHRFCGRHVRDVYREKESAGEAMYCNIDRGCFSILKDGEKRCATCIGAKKSTIANELEKLRITAALCLACNDTIKTNNYFCDDCTPKITSVRSLTEGRALKAMWTDFKNGAIKRDHVLTIDFNQFTNIAIRACAYCGQFSTDSYNGVDRIDSAKGYISSNVCACCTLCNLMKRIQHPAEFYDKVSAIAVYQTEGIPISDDVVSKWKASYLTRNIKFAQYKHSAKLRELEFDLIEEQFDEIRSQQCYLCGIPNSEIHKNGIDRIDSEKGYTMENCRSCCTHCNLIKMSHPIDLIVEKCKQIRGFFRPPVYDTTPDVARKATPMPTVEIYRSKDIYEILEKCGVSEFVAWAKRADKSAQFIEGIRAISLSECTQEEALNEIKHQLEKERKYRSACKDTPKQFTGLSMMSILMTHGKDEFDRLYRSKYDTISNSYVSQLDKVVDSLPTIEKKEAIALCSKFLCDENNRRRSKRNYAIDPALSTPTKRASWTYKEKSAKIPENKIVTIPVTVPETPEAAPVVSHVAPKTPSLPKHWKARSIYESIKAGKLDYKNYCESNNEFSDMVAWEETWCTFVKDVHEAVSYTDAKPIIERFIVELRSKRHLKLTKKDVVVRENRQLWPKESVMKALQAGKLDIYKDFVVKQHEGMDIDIDRRWDQLVRDLESTSDVSKQIECIRKFQTNLRTARYRRGGVGSGEVDRD